MYQLLKLSVYGREFMFSIHLDPSFSDCDLLTVVPLLEAAELGEQNRIQFH